MQAEIMWLQIVSILALYIAAKNMNIWINSWLRMPALVSIGIFAGHGFWKIFQTLSYNLNPHTLNLWQYSFYIFSIFSSLFVVGVVVIIFLRTITRSKSS